jgi:hypothetical protein
MRVGAAVRACTGHGESRAGRHHHRRGAGRFLDELVGPRLEPGSVVHEDAGAADLGYVLRGGLPVVAVDAGRHQRDHLRAVGRHLPGEVVHGEEGGHDERLAAGSGRLAAARGEGDAEEHERQARVTRGRFARESSVHDARTSRTRPKAHTTVAPVGVSKDGGGAHGEDAHEE